MSGAKIIGALPEWRAGRPDKPGTYFGYSDLPERPRETPSLYGFDGKVFQHWTGWYDHGVTHWMATDLPYDPPDRELDGASPLNTEEPRDGR